MRTGRWLWGSPGLRRRTTITFAAGGLLLSVLLAGATYFTARTYLIAQRERSAIRQAYADASLVRQGLRTTGAPVSDVLGRVAPPAGATVLLHRDGRWFSSSLTVGRDAVPSALVASVGNGRPAMTWIETDGAPAVVVGVPLPAVSADFYEVVHPVELENTLTTLRVVLLTGAGITAVAGAALGRWAAGRAVRPLDAVAGAATRIAGGDLRTRLHPTADPDLAAIVASFNSMVDALQDRIEREQRFTADVSHELRSPLTTLVTGISVLARQREELPARSQQALDLVTDELERFSRLLEDLLQLSRLDAGAVDTDREVVDLIELVRHALTGSGRSADVLAVPVVPGPSGRRTMRVAARKRLLDRALVNLFDNADRHGGGLVAVQLTQDSGSAYVAVDDAGAGVSPEDRERIFERFARGSATVSRGSTPGTGLGLNLVAETVRAHSGEVWYADRPGGGARFWIRLPLATSSGRGRI